MKLSSILRQAVRALDAQPRPAPSAKSAAPSADAFEVARRSPVALSARPPVPAGDAAFVTGLYRDLLGREPDAAGFQSHLNGLAHGMSRDAIRQVFLDSPELREKRQAAAQPSVQPAAAPVAAPSPSAEPAWRSVGPVPLEGYDSRKLADVSHQTVKYQFGRVASHFPLDSVKDKASAEALLNRMRPELEAAGLTVREIKGDKIRVDTELGQEWVDVVRGAGSGSPGWWWGSEGKAIPGTEGTGLPVRPGPVGPPTVPPPVTPPPTTPPGPTEPGAPLSTVPYRSEYASATIDRSSPAAAALSAARWTKEKYPELFAHADDRQVCFEIMTKTIGALRAAGFDATRVVNHPDRPVGDGWRYGSDAVVVGGTIFDVFGGIGATNTPQALDAGPYAAGRLRE